LLTVTALAAPAHAEMLQQSNQPSSAEKIEKMTRAEWLKLQAGYKKQKAKYTACNDKAKAEKLRGRKRRTTIADETAIELARDLLQRDFTATAPNEKWVCDLTYIRTWNGFCYLAFILDCYSRKIVGWQLATHMRAELVLDALEMANGLRRSDAGLIAHSDRGSQPVFTSIRYTERLEEIGAAASVGSKGDAYDNAMAEAWVATFKNELVDGRRFPSFEHAEHEVLHWIGFYNAERLPEPLGDLPPTEYEQLNIKSDNNAMVAAT